ncbi:MAG: PIG-L family deacetylase, partial [Nitrospirae bacterium]|nr:PIG-L family deacetylase [Nitrospirota bacterium]
MKFFGRSNRIESVYEEASKFSRELPQAERALVLAPHPDDETLGCAGTIIKYKKSGALVNCLVMTDGGKV